MAAPVTFGPDDRWQAFIDASWAFACQETGFTSESQCSVMPLARRPGDVTVAQGLDVVFAAVDGAEFVQWLSANRLSALSLDLRMRLLLEVCRRDPCYAGAVYLWQADLSEDEDVVLLAAFAPEMPLLVERVKRNPACRAKVRAAHG